LGENTGAGLCEMPNENGKLEACCLRFCILRCPWLCCWYRSSL